MSKAKIAFILASTDHGPLIVNRFDYKVKDDTALFGVGHFLLNNASFEGSEIGFLKHILNLRNEHFGDGVQVIDCGANIGVHTVEFARLLRDRGMVLAIEPQERLYGALWGNIILNNCSNARALMAVLGAHNGTQWIPVPDYHVPGSFGSLEMVLQPGVTEDIGQDVSYLDDAVINTPMITIDSLNMQRVDLIKLDVERMELDVLAGASETLDRCRPVLFIETMKIDKALLVTKLEEHGYEWFPSVMNLIAIHSDDPTLQDLKASLKVVADAE